MTNSSRSKRTAYSETGDHQGLSSSNDAEDGGAAPSGEPNPTMRPADAAEYIAQMTAELARIARTARLESLAYFLEMARIEAATCLRQVQNRR